MSTLHDFVQCATDIKEPYIVKAGAAADTSNALQATSRLRRAWHSVNGTYDLLQDRNANRKREGTGIDVLLHAWHLETIRDAFLGALPPVLRTH